MLSKDENENENENDKNETMNRNNNNVLKELNDNLDENNWQIKIIEEQIKSIRKVEKYWFTDDYGDKELEFKIFKLKLAHMSNIIHKKLFKQIFGHTFETLANKLINITNFMKNMKRVILTIM